MDLEKAFTLEVLDDCVRGVLRGALGRVDAQVRSLWHLIGESIPGKFVSSPRRA